MEAATDRLLTLPGGLEAHWRSDGRGGRPLVFGDARAMAMGMGSAGVGDGAPRAAAEASLSDFPEPDPNPEVVSLTRRSSASSLLRDSDLAHPSLLAAAVEPFCTAALLFSLALLGAAVGVVVEAGAVAAPVAFTLAAMSTSVSRSSTVVVRGLMSFSISSARRASSSVALEEDTDAGGSCVGAGAGGWPVNCLLVPAATVLVLALLGFKMDSN